MPKETLKILVIEDDLAVATTLERALADHRAIIETDAQAAYRRLLAGEWFDAVLCDGAVPEIDGHRLLATARELPDPPALVLMSSCTVVHTEVDVILRKPFPIEDLLDLLAILSRRRADQPTQRLPRMRKA